MIPRRKVNGGNVFGQKLCNTAIAAYQLKE